MEVKKKLAKITNTARGKIKQLQKKKREKHERNVKGPAEHASVSYDRPLL